MSYVIAISLISIIFGLLFSWIRKKFSFFEENRFPYDKPTFPFGNLKGIGKEIHIAEKLKKYYDQFKTRSPVFGIYFFLNPVYVVTDLDIVKDVLIKDFETFHNRGVYYNLKDDPLSGHLFAIDGADWKSMRVKLTPTFTSGKMKMVFNTVAELSNIMIDQLKSEPNLEMIEMKESLAKFTTDVIGNIAFGLEMNSIKDDDSMFRQIGRKVFNPVSNFQLKVLFLAAYRDLARLLRLTFFTKDVTEFFQNTIRETIEYRRKNNIDRNDMLDTMLKLYDDGKQEEGKITLNELTAQCFVSKLNVGRVHINFLFF